ncbi:MAG: hypothetical protein EZS28_005087, partial [Streblomastix strix]
NSKCAALFLTETAVHAHIQYWHAQLAEHIMRLCFHRPGVQIRERQDAAAVEQVQQQPLVMLN